MTAAAMLAGIGEELRAELHDAVHVVVHADDEDALLGCGASAVLSAPRDFGYGFVVGCCATDVVLCGNVDVLAWTARLHADAPSIRIWSLNVASAALALGWRPGERLDLDAIDRRCATWHEIVCRGARRIDWTLPTPAAPARKLRLRELRR